ncbi:MAG TPA: condensation domain-containing protein, partial [Herpetosiphonaceae bacterium]
QQPGATADDDIPAPDQELVLGPVPLLHHSLIFLDVDHANHHHWNIAFLLRAQLKLDRPIVEEVIAALLRHHDALRLRFTHDGSRWTQTINPPSEPLPLTWVDLADVPPADHAARIEAVAAQEQQRLNLFTGPVFSVTVFAAGPDQPDHLLVIVHHLVADAFSLRILLADFATAYRQRHAGHPIVLPPKSTSFQAWAERMYAFAQSDAVRADLQYWQALPWNEAAPIPMDHPERRGGNTLASQQVVWVGLTAEETRRLREELVPSYQVSLQDILLTAIARVIARWSGSSVVTLDLLQHGRNALLEGMDLSRTVGLIATGIPILFDLRAATTAESALHAVAEQLGRIPNQGLTHSLLTRITEDPEITEALRSMPRRDVFFNYLGQNNQSPDPERLLSAVEADIGPKQDPQTDRGFLLAFTGALVDQELRINIGYSTAVHEPATIERLAEACVEELRELLRLVPGNAGSASSQSHHAESGDEPPATGEIVTGPVPLLHNSIVFLEVDHPNHHHWNIAFLLRAQLKLDRPIVEEVIAALLRHHDALRLRFTRDGSRWTQTISPPSEPLPLTWVDLADVPPAGHAARIESVAAQQQQRLNLFTGPVFSVTVFAAGPDQPDHLLVIVHHLVADAFSLRILLADFATAYQQRHAGHSITLPPKSTSFQAWAERMYA